jgi:hypothetical protein
LASGKQNAGYQVGDAEKTGNWKPVTGKLSYLRTELCTTYFAACYFAFPLNQFTIFP